MNIAKSITLAISLLLLLSYPAVAQPQLVSVNRFGTGSGNNQSYLATVSANGRYVAFQSQAYNLVPNDTNGSAPDIFVRDLVSHKTTLVSVNKAGTGSGNKQSTAPHISTDGRYVVFTSEASDLVASDTNSYEDVFVRDLVAGTTTLVSVNHAGASSGNGGSQNFGFPATVISANGRYVVFQSEASDLVTNDTSSVRDIFIRDLVAGTTTLVSVDTAGTGSGNNYSYSPTISANGRFVSFYSGANNLVSNDFNGFAGDIFIRDVVAGTTRLVSINSAGSASGNDESSTFRDGPAMTPDGRFVAFVSDASDLVTNDINDTPDVFVRDVVAGTTELVSVNRTGTSSVNGYNLYPSISDNGRYVTFLSYANDLVANDQNQSGDIFVRDLVADKTMLVSVNSAGNASGNRHSVVSSISANGRFVVFETLASNIVPNDLNGAFRDIFLRDLGSQTTTLLSVNRSSTGSGNGPSSGAIISKDGQTVVFSSLASNLVTNDRSTNSDIYAVSLAHGTIQFNAPVYSFSEHGGTATITLKRTGGSRGAVSVDFATSNGSATAGQDYAAVMGTINFADGEKIKTVTIPVTDDSVDEPSDTVNLNLSHPTGGALLGVRTTALLDIVDDELSPNPLVINFEDGTNGEAIGSFYSGWGVTFSNARFVSSAGHFGGSNLSFTGLKGPGPSTPIVIVFKTPIRSVFVTGIDLNGQGFLVKSYGDDGRLIAQAGSLGGGSYGYETSVGAVAPPRIKRIEIYQPANTQGTSGGLLLDNLTIKR